MARDEAAKVSVGRVTMGLGHHREPAALPEDRGGPLQDFLRGSNTAVSSEMHLPRGNTDTGQVRWDTLEVRQASCPEGRDRVWQQARIPEVQGTGFGCLEKVTGMAKRTAGLLIWMVVSRPQKENARF